MVTIILFWIRRHWLQWWKDQPPLALHKTGWTHCFMCSLYKNSIVCLNVLGTWAVWARCHGTCLRSLIVLRCLKLKNRTWSCGFNNCFLARQLWNPRNLGYVVSCVDGWLEYYQWQSRINVTLCRLRGIQINSVTKDAVTTTLCGKQNFSDDLWQNLLSPGDGYRQNSNMFFTSVEWEEIPTRLHIFFYQLL